MKFRHDPMNAKFNVIDHEDYEQLRRSKDYRGTAEYSYQIPLRPREVGIKADGSVRYILRDGKNRYEARG